jgi:hypothetical protein
MLKHMLLAEAHSGVDQIHLLMVDAGQVLLGVSLISNGISALGLRSAGYGFFGFWEAMQY